MDQLVIGPLLFLIYINYIVNSSNVLSFVLSVANVQNDSMGSAIEILNTCRIGQSSIVV